MSGSRFSKRRGRNESDVKRELKRFVIITEGDEEKKYFQSFHSETGPLVKAKRSKHERCGIVDEAIEWRRQLIKKGYYDIELDETWVVFDRDRNDERLNDEENYVKAIKYAEANKIKVAYSNDAFQLWIVLHFQDIGSEMSVKELDRIIKKRIPAYQHGDDVYQIIKTHGGDQIKAIERSKQLKRRASQLHSDKEIYLVNPTTNVDELVEKLLDIDG